MKHPVVLEEAPPQRENAVGFSCIPSPHDSRAGWYPTICTMAAIVAVFVVVFGFLMRPAFVRGESMSPTLEEGDFLTMDFGCLVNGYCSDMTRTIVYGRADEKQKEIYDVVLQAQMTALQAIKPGMTGKEVDAIARDVIKEAGYGDCFGHSLGHSVGLEIHETPCFSPREESVIEPGMVITVEPGIYVEGFGGVRIEDVVVITENGCENITHSPKERMEIQ